MIAIQLPPGKYPSDLGIDPSFEEAPICKAMFELARDTDMETHFDSEIHTREVIAAGLPGFHAGVTCRAIEVADLPTDRYFRDAWEDNGVLLQVNRSKAEAIQMAHIRRARDIKLEKESGSRFQPPAEIEALFSPARKAKLRALRDLPADFDLSTFSTFDELQAAWPNELPPRGIS